MKSSVCAIIGMLIGFSANLVSSELKCPETNGLFLHPGSFDCQSFVKCTNGVPSVIHCGNGRQFHIEKGACVTQSAVSCDLQWVKILDPSTGSKRTDRANSEGSSSAREAQPETFHAPWFSENDFSNQRTPEKVYVGRKLERLRDKNNIGGSTEELSHNSRPPWDRNEIEVPKVADENSLDDSNAWSDYNEVGLWYDPETVVDNNVADSDWDESSYASEWEPDNTFDNFVDNTYEPYEEESEWDSGDNEYYTNDDMESFMSSVHESDPFTGISSTYMSSSDKKPKKSRNDIKTTIHKHSEVYKFNASSDPFKEGDTGVNGMSVKIVNDQNSTYTKVNNVTKVATTRANNQTTSVYEVPSSETDIKKTSQIKLPKIKPFDTKPKMKKHDRRPTTKPKVKSTGNTGNVHGQTFTALSSKYRPIQHAKRNKQIQSGGKLRTTYNEGENNGNGTSYINSKLTSNSNIKSTNKSPVTVTAFSSDISNYEKGPETMNDGSAGKNSESQIEVNSNTEIRTPETHVDIMRVSPMLQYPDYVPFEPEGYEYEDYELIVTSHDGDYEAHPYNSIDNQDEIDRSTNQQTGEAFSGSEKTVGGHKSNVDEGEAVDRSSSEKSIEEKKHKKFESEKNVDKINEETHVEHKDIDKDHEKKSKDNHKSDTKHSKTWEKKKEYYYKELIPIPVPVQGAAVPGLLGGAFPRQFVGQYSQPPHSNRASDLTSINKGNVSDSLKEHNTNLHKSQPSVTRYSSPTRYPSNNLWYGSWNSPQRQQWGSIQRPEEQFEWPSGFFTYRKK